MGNMMTTLEKTLEMGSEKAEGTGEKVWDNVKKAWVWVGAEGTKLAELHYGDTERALDAVSTTSWKSLVDWALTALIKLRKFTNFFGVLMSILGFSRFYLYAILAYYQQYEGFRVLFILLDVLISVPSTLIVHFLLPWFFFRTVKHKHNGGYIRYVNYVVVGITVVGSFANTVVTAIMFVLYILMLIFSGTTFPVYGFQWLGVPWGGFWWIVAAVGMLTVLAELSLSAIQTVYMGIHFIGGVALKGYRVINLYQTGELTDDQYWELVTAKKAGLGQKVQKIVEKHMKPGSSNQELIVKTDSHVNINGSV